MSITSMGISSSDADPDTDVVTVGYSPEKAMVNGARGDLDAILKLQCSISFY